MPVYTDMTNYSAIRNFLLRYEKRCFPLMIEDKSIAELSGQASSDRLALACLDGSGSIAYTKTARAEGSLAGCLIKRGLNFSTFVQNFKKIVVSLNYSRFTPNCRRTDAGKILPNFNRYFEGEPSCPGSGAGYLLHKLKAL